MRQNETKFDSHKIEPLRRSNLRRPPSVVSHSSGRIGASLVIGAWCLEASTFPAWCFFLRLAPPPRRA